MSSDNFLEQGNSITTKVKVCYNAIGHTLVVWFGEPSDEVEAEETGDEVILMKAKTAELSALKSSTSYPRPINLFALHSRPLSLETMVSPLLTFQKELNREIMKLLLVAA